MLATAAGLARDWFTGHLDLGYHNPELVLDVDDGGT
jgi:hypothetical protein